jgi:hypothetical protein
VNFLGGRQNLLILRHCPLHPDKNENLLTFQNFSNKKFKILKLWKGLKYHCKVWFSSIQTDCLAWFPKPSDVHLGNQLTDCHFCHSELLAHDSYHAMINPGKMKFVDSTAKFKIWVSVLLMLSKMELTASCFELEGNFFFVV